MEKFNTVQHISVAILPILLAITVHEAAHGWAARQLGDNTAALLGRLTLNPLKHIDPIGTILVPAVLYLSAYLTGGGGFIFGWAKPVPVDWSKLGNPKRDMAYVALAGPMANLLMAVLWAMVAKIGIMLNSPFATQPMVLMGGIGITINLVLLVLNLLPLLPLDGGRILASLLPGPLAWKYSKLEPYGIYILIALMFVGLLGPILSFPMPLLHKLVTGIAGL